MAGVPRAQRLGAGAAAAGGRVALAVRAGAGGRGQGLSNTGRRPDPKGSLSHLGLRVGTSGEVESWKERLTARGVSGFEEKDTTCCYARQDKFWVSDPDGNKWEVYTVLEDVEVAKDQASTCCAPGEKTATAAAGCCA